MKTKPTTNHAQGHHVNTVFLVNGHAQTKSNVDEHIDKLIELYQSLWSTAKRNELDALENQGTKINRQKLPPKLTTTQL